MKKIEKKLRDYGTPQEQERVKIIWGELHALYKEKRTIENRVNQRESYKNKKKSK